MAETPTSAPATKSPGNSKTGRSAGTGTGSTRTTGSPQAKVPPAKGKTPPIPGAATPASTPAQSQREAVLRRMLLKRLAIAGGVITGLLASLAVFDHFSAEPASEESPPRFTQAVPVGKPGSVAGALPAVAPAPPAAPPVAPATEPVATPASTVVPGPTPLTTDKAASPAAPAGNAANKPVTPSVTVQSRTTAPANPPVTPPVSNTPLAAARPIRPTGESNSAAPAKPLPPPPPPQVSARPPTILSESDLAPTPPAAPRVKPAVPTVTTVQATPASLRQLSGFKLQSPVFTNTQEAETLYRRLKENNIPATLETRVKVGPFRTREEAELARERMEALGIMMNDMVPPKASRR